MKVKDSGANDLPALEKELGIPLPPGTQILVVEREAGMDDRVRAKLRMTRQGFNEVLSRLPLKESELRPGAGRLGTDRGKWDPHATVGLRSGQVGLENGRYLNLGVAEGEASAVTVFVVNHGT